MADIASPLTHSARTASSPGQQVLGRVENPVSLHPLYVIAGRAVRAIDWKTARKPSVPLSELIAADSAGMVPSRHHIDSAAVDPSAW